MSKREDRKPAKNSETLSNPEQGSWPVTASRKDLISLIERLPVGVAVLRSGHGKALYINNEILATLGYPLSETPTTRELNKKLMPDARERRESTRLFEEYAKTGVRILPRLCTYTCKDGVSRTFEHRIITLRKNLIVSLWIDATEREAAQAELRKREAWFRAFFEKSKDPFLLFDGDGLVDCNLAAQHLFNCESKEQILGGTLEALSSEKQPGGSLARKKAFVVSGKALSQGDHRTEWTIRTLDGKDIPVELSSGTVKLEGKNLIFMVLRDVTQWKEAQNVLLHAKVDLENAVKTRTSELIAVNEKLRESREELRHLSEYLQRAREEERIRIAREVHDHVGQFLTGLKMNLVYQARNPSGDAAARLEQTNTMVAQIDSTILNVRDICSKLRPSILGDFGLAAAIRWYLEDFQERTAVRCTARMSPDMSALDEDLAVVLFRIFQEAMTNILRHAAATKVTVSLKHKTGSIMLRVKDNGKGILAEEVTDPRSFGIIGIRERVRFWGGHLEVKGIPNKGTIVTVRFPMNCDMSGHGTGYTCGI